VLDVTEADYDRLFNVNAKGAFFTMQQAARTVNGGGSIVYIGSGSTLRRSPASVSTPGKLARWISGQQLLVSGGTPG
jgi:NAD(P)-dependent dehydrogenase (short-subunit alcohol dehydrogenase family)